MNKLKQLREAAGLSQAVLAQKAKVNQTTISHVEAGRTYAYPAFRRRVAKVLGFREFEIFETETKIK